MIASCTAWNILVLKTDSILPQRTKPERVTTARSVHDSLPSNAFPSLDGIDRHSHSPSKHPPFDQILGTSYASRAASALRTTGKRSDTSQLDRGAHL